MFNRKRVFIVAVFIAIVSTVLGWYFFTRQAGLQYHSLLLYTSYSKDRVNNWILDMDDRKQWEVGKGLEAGRWSPSGKYISFYTYLRKVTITTIWVSNPDGSNLRKVFDLEQYPDLNIKSFIWLSDDTFIVNVEEKQNPQGGGIYFLNISDGSLKVVNIGNAFIDVSPSGKFWVQYNSQDKYHLADMNGNTAPIEPQMLEYHFSSSGNRLAYALQSGDKDSLWIADVSVNGIANRLKLTEMDNIDALFVNWSPDGNYIGFQSYYRDGGERFRAIDSRTGELIYDWPWANNISAFLWSPLSNQVINSNGVLLDLKTGIVYSLFKDKSIPSEVKDWRLIKASK